MARASSGHEEAPDARRELAGRKDNTTPLPFHFVDAGSMPLLGMARVGEIHILIAPRCPGVIPDVQAFDRNGLSLGDHARGSPSAHFDPAEQRDNNA